MRTLDIQVTLTQEDETEVTLEVNPPSILMQAGERLAVKWNFVKVPANIKASMSLVPALVVPGSPTRWLNAWPYEDRGQAPEEGPDGWTAIAGFWRASPGSYTFYVRVEFEIAGPCGGVFVLYYQVYFPSDWSPLTNGQDTVKAEVFAGVPPTKEQALEFFGPTIYPKTNVETPIVWNANYRPFKPARPYVRLASGRWPGANTPELFPPEFGYYTNQIQASIRASGTYTCFFGVRTVKQPGMTIWFNGAIQTLPAAG